MLGKRAALTYVCAWMMCRGTAGFALSAPSAPDLAPMNRRFAAFAALLCAAAALGAAPAAAQTDTTAATAATGTPAGAETQGQAEAAPQPQVPRARRSLNVISYEEVRNAHVSDAQELIHNLRPSWLRTPRGMTSFASPIDVAVFKDGIRMGSREALVGIPITTIRMVRFYSAVDARQKFGGDTSAGAIEITSQQ
jgi:hypothetical protein